MLRLSAGTKDKITPLIEVPEMGWDFENKVEAKTLDKHLAPFAERVHKKWGNGPCFVDLQLLKAEARLSEGTHPVDFVFDELRHYRCASVPVTGPERDGDYQQAVRRAASQDRRGVCLRLRLEQAAKDDDDVQRRVDGLLGSLAVQPDNTDFVLDLRAPKNFDPLAGFSRLLQSIIARIPYLAEWRTFTMIGTSFPSTMGALDRGPQEIVRREWLLYKHLAGALGKARRRLPTFGDYTITHPAVVLLDMRKVRPAASLRYTVDDAWYIIKGRNVRDYGFEQYQDLCRVLISSGSFAGRMFSKGDAYIEDRANGKTKGPGNLMTWRQVGTNHHIVKVVEDIANLHGSASAN